MWLWTLQTCALWYLRSSMFFFLFSHQTSAWIIRGISDVCHACLCCVDIRRQKAGKHGRSFWEVRQAAGSSMQRQSTVGHTWSTFITVLLEQHSFTRLPRYAWPQHPTTTTWTPADAITCSLIYIHFTAFFLPDTFVSQELVSSRHTCAEIYSCLLFRVEHVKKIRWISL